MIAPRLSALRPDHLLVGAMLLLVTIAAWPWLVSPAPTHRPTALAPAVAPGPTLAALPPLGSFSAIVERPLFSASRRPAPGAATVTAAGASIESRYRLLGIMAAGSRKKAFVADGTRRIELIEGDTVEGWRVKEVGANHLLLSSPDGDAVIRLKPAAAAEPPKPQ